MISAIGRANYEDKTVVFSKQGILGIALEWIKLYNSRHNFSMDHVSKENKCVHESNAINNKIFLI